MSGVKKHISAFIAFALVLAAGGRAEARETDGTLGLIVTPNDGMPALISTGGVFAVQMREPGALRAVDSEGNSTELSVAWDPEGPAPGARFATRSGKVSAPPTLKAGCYSLQAESVNGRKDTMQRAVFVYDGFPDLYGVFHLSDCHFGRGAPATPAANLKSLLARAVEKKCTLVAITGDLTDSGTPEQYQEFIRVLNTCSLPTFVCPGNHDRGDDQWARYFGPQTYYFTFGQDGYLAYDTKDFNTADETGPQDTALEVYRRAIQPCRWRIGLTHRYEPNQGMRSQLTLFLDKPLDWLLFGHWHRENKDNEKTTPWGLTKLIVTPAALNGSYRIIEVSSRGLRAYPSQLL